MTRMRAIIALPSALCVIANRGPGTAYRVTVTVRSGIMSLHGRRVGFGVIPPSTEKHRRLSLGLPTSETASDTMLVFAFDEGNGFSPPGISHRVPIIARDRRFARSAQATIVGVIRKPRLCATDQLTHTQYRAKLAELRVAMAAGDLTQDQFDRYDAELVNCLNDAP